MKDIDLDLQENGDSLIIKDDQPDTINYQGEQVYMNITIRRALSSFYFVSQSVMYSIRNLME